MSQQSIRLLVLSIAVFAHNQLWSATQPNLLIITVDDMSCDSMGVYGCRVAETTPRMDALAEKCLRFEHAHVVVGNCMPSRNVMWSGRYPHNTGVEGFYQVHDAKYPHLVDLMQKAGYFTAIRGKVSHSTPYSPYHWDLVLDKLPDGTQAHIKDVKSYGISARMGFDAAKATGRPFCVMINVSDPHKPFYAQGRGGETIHDPNPPSRVFTADEMVVPGFLFEDPEVRQELAHYYSSVRRADDCVGEVLDALQATGQADHTVIVFLSDHGMPLPFAKTQVYHHSSRTPLMIHWPGVTKGGTKDEQHLVSAVDLLPTILDILDLPHPEEMDGRSFAPLLRGETQADRDFVIKEYNENSGRSRDPMRAIQTKEYLYIFNPWSNGERIFATATSGTETYRRMKELAASDTAINARHELYQHRVVEELYRVSEDPNCLVNLIDRQDETATLDFLRMHLEQVMVKTQDHCLEAFRQRDDPAAMENYILRKEAEAASRGGKKRQPVDENALARRRQNRNLIQMSVPEEVKRGETFTVQIDHKLPKRLGEQKLHVTLKQGTTAQRVERKVITVSGTGQVEVTFDVPDSVQDHQLSCAVFVGEDFQTNLQHLQSPTVLCK